MAKALKKLSKDDVIVLDEKLLPRSVIARDISDDFTPGKEYQVIGISWLLFSDRTRCIGYILENDKGVVDIFMSGWFSTIKKSEVVKN